MFWIIVISLVVFFTTLIDILAISGTQFGLGWCRPRNLYLTSKMNIVGCYISCALWLVASPLFGLGRIIYFLFTVGRKK